MNASQKETYDRIFTHFNAYTEYTHDEFKMVWNLTKPFKIKKGGFIYLQGQPCTYGGYILEGCTRHYHVDENMEEHTVGFEFEDYCFGDLRSIFFGTPSPTTLQVLEHTKLMRMEKSAYLYLVDNCKPFSKMMFLALESRYSRLVDVLIKNKSEMADHRYLEMLELYPQILKRVPQRYIASYLGIQPQSLSRIRRNITARGEVKAEN